MTKNQELIFTLLKDMDACLTSKEISRFLYRKYKLSLTPSTIGGFLRALKDHKLVESSNCGLGSNYYWVKKGATID